MEVRGQTRVHFIRHCAPFCSSIHSLAHHLFILRRYLSLGLKVTYQVRLSRQQAPRISLSLLPNAGVSSIWHQIQHFLSGFQNWPWVLMLAQPPPYQLRCLLSPVMSHKIMLSGSHCLAAVATPTSQALPPPKWQFCALLPQLPLFLPQPPACFCSRNLTIIGHYM